MNIDDLNNESEWLKQQYNSQIIREKPKPNVSNIPRNKRTPNNYKCCDNEIIASTNDGNKTIFCANCNYIYRSPNISPIFPLHLN